MSTNELAMGLGLTAVLLALAGYYVWRQRLLTHQLGTIDDAETQHWLKTQIRRRLTCSALLVVLAGMLVGWWLIEGRLGQPAAQDADAGKRLAAEIFVYYWAVFLLILLGVFLLAALDVAANARFGYRQLRKLDQARQQMLEEEAARYRERNTPPSP